MDVHHPHSEVVGITVNPDKSRPCIRMSVCDIFFGLNNYWNFLRFRVFRITANACYISNKNRTPTLRSGIHAEARVVYNHRVILGTKVQIISETTKKKAEIFQFPPYKTIDW